MRYMLDILFTSDALCLSLHGLRVRSVITLSWVWEGIWFTMRISLYLRLFSIWFVGKIASNLRSKVVCEGWTCFEDEANTNNIGSPQLMRAVSLCILSCLHDYLYWETLRKLLISQSINWWIHWSGSTPIEILAFGNNATRSVELLLIVHTN